MCRTQIFRSIGAHVGAVFSAKFRRHAPEAPTITAEARVAACALLLEIAWADGVFTDAERELVEMTVRQQFGLGTCEARQLVDEAAEARRRGMPVWHFTRAVRNYNDGQRRLLADFLQAIADLDGAASTREAFAVERINRLMRVDETWGPVAA